MKHLFAGILLALALATPAHAAKRAFVAGVGEYASLTRLTKTEGDAAGYAEVFRDDLKFEVSRAPANATRSQFLAAFGAFLQTIEAGDEVAFIFSGHGWSDGAENYLILSDAPKGGSELLLKNETVALSMTVLAEIKRRNPKMVFAIIDACRDNPFDGFTMNSFGKGMVPTPIIPGTLVVFSAGARQKALDRLSDNDPAPHSVFTRSLLPKLKNPNEPLMRAIDAARDDVERMASTISHVQRPAVYSDVSMSFCFSGACAGAPASDPETEMWLEVTAGAGQDPCAGYERYRAAFPRGRFTERASSLLAGPPCAAPAPATTAATARTTRQFSAIGMALLARFESFQEKAFDDPSGYCTIGFGHLIDRKPCAELRDNPLVVQGIKVPAALELMNSDIKSGERAINELVQRSLTQNEFDALVAFIYNSGIAAFERSTLLRAINASDSTATADQWLRWSMFNGKLMPGLQARRRAELDLFQLK